MFGRTTPAAHVLRVRTTSTENIISVAALFAHRYHRYYRLRRCFRSIRRSRWPIYFLLTKLARISRVFFPNETPLLPLGGIRLLYCTTYYCLFDFPGDVRRARGTRFASGSREPIARLPSPRCVQTSVPMNVVNNTIIRDWASVRGGRRSTWFSCLS